MHGTIVKVCAERECGRKVRGLGLCEMHYQRKRRLDRHCSEPGCDRKINGRGLCNKHYLKLRYGERSAQPIPSGEKICGACGISKPFSGFVRHGGCRDGFRPECRECLAAYQKIQRENYKGPIQRKYSLKKNFGLSIEQFVEMFEAQDGKCAICKTPDPAPNWIKNFCVDHDHDTGKIRGLLCRQCNSGLGFFKDKPSLLRAAAGYLSVHGKENV